MQIAAHPYPFPFNGQPGPLGPGLMILGCDQAQLTETGGAGHAALANVERLQTGFSTSGWPVVFGRRGVGDFADLTPVVRARNDIRTVDRILELSDPLARPAIRPHSATTFCHAADNAFIGSDLSHILKIGGVQVLVFCGLVTDGSVHATMREANDRGFECLLVTDASASTRPAFHDTIISLTAFGNGLFGCVASTDAVLAAMAKVA
jgi:nicotinamidase-related amidase